MTKPTEDNSDEWRDAQGRALASMGHVTRTDDGFEVSSLKDVMRVWRDVDGRIQCSCVEWEAHHDEDPRFRCEHVLAVKYYIEPPVAAARSDEYRPYRLWPETLAELSRPLPEEAIKQRVGWTDRQGNEHEVDYVEWHVVADILDRVTPHWTHRVKGILQIGGLVAVTVSIEIDGVTREGIGTGEAIDEKGIKKAEHDALKRAAVKFGIARELYRKVEEFPGVAKAKDDPVARTITDLVTPKQLVAIRAIANAAGIDAEKRSLELFNCRPEELTKAAASKLIDDLKNTRGSAT